MLAPQSSEPGLLQMEIAPTTFKNSPVSTQKKHFRSVAKSVHSSIHKLMSYVADAFAIEHKIMRNDLPCLVTGVRFCFVGGQEEWDPFDSQLREQLA